MLRPSKHSHPDQTVLAMSLGLLQRLRARRIESFESLRSFAKARVAGGDVLFLPALSFLFLMGVLAYHPKNDSFEYLDPR